MTSVFVLPTSNFMCTFSHLHPYNILQVHEGEGEMGAGAGFLRVTDTVNTFFFFSIFLRPSGCCISYFIHEEL